MNKRLHKNKHRHRRYTEISLKYSSIYSLISEVDQRITTFVDENSSLWSDNCSLRLFLRLDGKIVFYTCNINTLLDMYLKPGKYYPFTCDDCDEPGCAGIFAPCRIIHSGEDIILCLRQPLQEKYTQGWRYRAFKLRKKDFLSELLDAMHFRISLENKLKIFEDTQDEEQQWKSIRLLIDIFGLESCWCDNKKISENIRKAFPILKMELLKMTGVKICRK